MSPRWKRFRRGPDDTLVVSLAPEEMALLVGLPAELRSVFDAPKGDPGAERLFPPAYLDPNEVEAEAEYEALVQPDLLRQRLDALELVTSSFTRAVEAGEWREIALTPDDVGAWLGVLNDTRLVLGTRLEVTEDGRDIDDADPNIGAYRIYDWLTYLQGELIDQLLGLTRTDVDDTGEREGLEQLAERVIGPRGTGREGVLPSADLCTIALRVAEALEVYERDGGTAHREDVLRNEEFRGVVVLGKCKTALPRPQGRWEVAVSDGTDDEWVIGEAGGSWTVEGLERLTGGTLPDQRVGVDASGSSAAPPVARRGRRARQAPAGWHPDPEARHDLRLFDGTAWTRFVVDLESTDG